MSKEFAWLYPCTLQPVTHQVYLRDGRETSSKFDAEKWCPEITVISRKRAGICHR
jgi:hypothetical protein